MAETWAVLLTTHERADVTRACLQALASQVGHDVTLQVVVCDAGSTDGTPDAIREVVPDATVLERGPELFWAGGMRVAWGEALTRDVDAHLWLNDDTTLDPDAIARLAAARTALGQDAARTVLVGATRDPQDGHLTYSGVHRPDPRRPLAFTRVEPRDELVPVETMNGNCVLVPHAVATDVGNLDETFSHGMADFDWGLRAAQRGHHLRLLPGTIGTCRANPPAPRRTIAEQWRSMRSTKHLAAGEWTTFARRWGGPAWPLYAASPYVRGVVAAARGQLRRRSS